MAARPELKSRQKLIANGGIQLLEFCGGDNQRGSAIVMVPSNGRGTNSKDACWDRVKATNPNDFTKFNLVIAKGESCLAVLAAQRPLAVPFISQQNDPNVNTCLKFVERVRCDVQCPGKAGTPCGGKNSLVAGQERVYVSVYNVNKR